MISESADVPIGIRMGLSTLLDEEKELMTREDVAEDEINGKKGSGQKADTISVQLVCSTLLMY